MNVFLLNYFNIPYVKYKTTSSKSQIITLADRFSGVPLTETQLKCWRKLRKEVYTKILAYSHISIEDIVSEIVKHSNDDLDKAFSDLITTFSESFDYANHSVVEEKQNFVVKERDIEN